MIPETVPLEGHCLYLIFLPFAVCSGSAAEEVDVEISVSAAASTTASLVAETISDSVIEAVMVVEDIMLVVDIDMMLEDVVVGIPISMDVGEADSLVAVGPTVDMKVSDGVELMSDQEEGAGEVDAASASRNSVGEAPTSAS